MGINKAFCKFLIHAQKRDKPIRGRVLTLGRLELYIAPKEAEAMVHSKFPEAPAMVLKEKEGKYSEPLLRMLGAGTVDSMDASDYEDATIIHDLNLPVPKELHESFDCIIDGGTLEHVFHFPNAIESCMRMLRTGGYYIALTPANNQMGHGFYQFSPELYFAAFSRMNGFEMRQMLIHSSAGWFEVSDPKVVKSRVTLDSSVPMMLAVIAQKVAPITSFSTPQQDSYERAWEVVDSIRQDQPLEGESAARHWARRNLPVGLKTFMRRMVGSTTRKTMHADGLGPIDQNHFKRVEI